VVADAFAVRRGGEPFGAFDVVAVLGLLDYVEDRAVPELLGGLAESLVPGGRMLLSNLHEPNPWRSMMELTADWNVFHRTVPAFETLVARSEAFVDVHSVVHASGTNLYCRAVRAG
jgi:extracellular factor (EF) 3-hydroxypalmitic acid methyl ester biosynthesis protein